MFLIHQKADSVNFQKFTIGRRQTFKDRRCPWELRSNHPSVSALEEEMILGTASQIGLLKGLLVSFPPLLSTEYLPSDSKIF